MNFPENLKYTKEHEWVRIEGDEAFVGITEFAQKELGDIVYVEVETQGETLSKDEIFGTIEAVKTVSDLFMPLSGEVLQVNEELGESPELANEDPYGRGWIIKIAIKDKAEIEELIEASDYKEMVV